MSNPIRRAVGAAMILAPVLGIVSAVAAPPLHGSASAELAEIARHQSRWYVYALFIIVSTGLLVPAIVGLVSLLDERLPRLGLVGGGLALVGALVATGDATTELMYWQMGAPGADRAQMVALSDRYDHAAGASLIFSVGGLAVIVGLAIIGVGLWRTGAAPAWAALGVPAGAIVNIVGFSISSNGIVVASNVVLLAALGWIAREFVVPAPSGARRGSEPRRAARATS
jgi:hypothetical protein